MSTYPTSPRSDFLSWAAAHQQIFIDNAAAIGLTPAQATAFAFATTGAADADLAQVQAQEAAKVATQQVNDAVDVLRGEAGDVVRSIRAFAETQANPNAIYALAQIPAPADPTPAPPPAEPKNLIVTLEPQNGNLMLKWKASNPPGTSGTAYIVKRRLPKESDFQFIGVTGTKEFVDTTLIAGPDSVQYTVQGQRGNSAGPVSQVFTVTFGRLAGGALTAYVGNSMSSMGVAKSVGNGATNGKGYANGVGNGMARMGV